MNISMQAAGDAALKVTFRDTVSPELNKEVQLFCQKLQASNVEGIVEWVPAFDSVTIYYQPQIILYHELCEKMTFINEKSMELKELATRLIHVPVVYGGVYGPDLERVAVHNQISVAEVIRIHKGPEYLVYMLGFLPGFPYLGELDKRIATPRLENPRAKTVAGAVGIAHEQTGIYPVESPGGWNIIGKTPIQLFDRQRGEAGFLFHAGDRVRFYEVSEGEFKAIELEVDLNEFEVIVEKR